MSLTTRLLVSFLAAIGLVLAGFSAATYAVARHHFRDRLRDRVSAVMDTLLAECNAVHLVGFFPDGKRALVREDRQIDVGPGGVIPDGKLLRESEDGGLAELDESWFRRAPKSATCRSRSATRASNPTTTAAIAAHSGTGIASHNSDGMDYDRGIPDNGIRSPRRSSRTRQAVNGYLDNTPGVGLLRGL